MARIHHVSCATVCPYGGSLLGGDGPPWKTAPLVAHCLVIESSDGLVLVDTGFGTRDVADSKRLGQPFRVAVRPKLSEADTALARIRALGLDPADVRHIVVTHLDVDHAGGLSDFPEASVHIHATEHATAMDPPLSERLRYVKAHWEHGPKWVTYGPGGDEWMGLESIRAIPGVDEEILLIPLPGHTRGHSAVAVRNGDGWLLHCGDCYFHRDEMEIPPSGPPGLRFFQNAVGWKRGPRLANQERLRELRREHGSEVDMFCAHDPTEFARFTAG